jgi:glycosyltransferase involved in cell wall biosynthesis
VTRPRILYFLNGLGIGGAEMGLRTLLEQGLFENMDFRVVLIERGSEELYRDISLLVGTENIIAGGNGTRLTVLGSAMAGVKFLHQLITFKPDIVVLSLKQANIIGRSILHLFPGIRCIAFEHIAQLEKGRMATVYERTLRTLSGRVDEVWGDSIATLKATQGYYSGPRRQETFVPLFVAPDGAPRKHDYGLHNPVRILVVSRLIPRKRIDVLLRAVRLLLDDGLEVEITIFGDGPGKPRLQALVGELQLSSAVTFAGFVKDWWQEATNYDLFVHLSDDEGFCIAVAEAMMIGLPVVASAVGGVIDYSKHSSDAWHMHSLEPAELAGVLQDLLTDHEKRMELGRRAASAIQSQFGRERVRSRYTQIAATFTKLEAGNTLRA